MKTILGIVASQRRLGNSEILLKEAALANGSDYRLDLVRLADLNLQPCKGCYTCLVSGKLCSLNDDLYFLADKIKEADGIIWTAPVYGLGPAAVTKLLGDRIIALVQRLDDFWSKPCIIIGTAGIKGWEGYTMSALVAQTRLLGFTLKDAQMFLGALPGESIENEMAFQRVREMGQALFGAARQTMKSECPTCWSEIWKFVQLNHVVCPICGQEAHLEHQGEKIILRFDDMGIRFTREGIRDHKEWLRGKVQEYISRRKELALVRDPYKDVGNWLIP